VTGTRTLSTRARRTAAATAGLGLVALLSAPGAMAAYNDVAPTPTTEVLGVKYSAAPAPVKASTQVLGTKHSSGSLAHTGAEIGAAGAAGVALVAGGALLVRSSRRRGTSAA